MTATSESSCCWISRRRAAAAAVVSAAARCFRACSVLAHDRISAIVIVSCGGGEATPMSGATSSRARASASGSRILSPARRTESRRATGTRVARNASSRAVEWQATSVAPSRQAPGRCRAVSVVMRELLGCDRRDSNPHGLPHRILSPARLPVPPRSRDRLASTYVLLRRRGSVQLCRNCAVAPLNPRRYVLRILNVVALERGPTSPAAQVHDLPLRHVRPPVAGRAPAQIVGNRRHLPELARLSIAHRPGEARPLARRFPGAPVVLERLAA